MELDQARGVFVQEARELLTDMEAALLEIEECGVSGPRINAVFRAAHTIKGAAGLFALELIVDFTHCMESVLVRVRNDELAMDPALCALMLRCGDYMAHLIDALEAGDTLADPDPQTRAALLDALQRHLAPASGAGASGPVPDATPAPPPGGRDWRIVLHPGADLLRQGLDPLPFIDYLERHGEIERIATLSERLPAFAELDPEACYLGFEIVLRQAADRDTLLRSFEFIAEDSRIEIVPLAAAGADIANIADTAAPAAGVAARRAAERRPSEQSMVKVEARKLDELIDAVGEMVIASAGSRVLAARNGDPSLREALAEMEALVERIRDRSLELRMTPIGDVFQRFPRVVRDLAQELGKKIELSISGADAELDKSMVDKLSDPLLHIVRNAIDHGIEATADRRAAGKPEHGRLHLNAFHESGSIVVEISDDGRGLDRARIRAKAVEKGLLAADATLSEEETFALIFAPGFSTAEQVTDISGRGVGMDVVRQNIEQLRGSVQIESRAGLSTTFRIQLPLTLAIIDGFQVAVGAASFILPLDLIEECVDVSGRADDGHVVALRGEALPVIELAAAFGIGQAGAKGRSLVVVRYGNRRAGILVDRFVGEMQAVIKPLGRLLRGVRGLGGSTILGDGSVALILDIPNLIHGFIRNAHAESAPAARAAPTGA